MFSIRIINSRSFFPSNFALLLSYVIHCGHGSLSKVFSHFLEIQVNNRILFQSWTFGHSVICCLVIRTAVTILHYLYLHSAKFYRFVCFLFILDSIVLHTPCNSNPSCFLSDLVSFIFNHFTFSFINYLVILICRSYNIINKLSFPRTNLYTYIDITHTHFTFNICSHL